jgi:hypothetical protein
MRSSTASGPVLALAATRSHLIVIAADLLCDPD